MLSHRQLVIKRGWDGLWAILVTYYKVVSICLCLAPQQGQILLRRYAIVTCRACDMSSSKLTDKVSRPRVGQLVSNHIDVGSISTDQCRRCESEDGVFHSAVPR